MAKVPAKRTGQTSASKPAASKPSAQQPSGSRTPAPKPAAGPAGPARRPHPREGREPHARVPRLADLIGQDRAIEQIRLAWAAGRIPHAWIFTGPPGVGKRTAAVAFAAALLDPGARVDDRGVPDADPASDTSALLRASTHPGLAIVTKELALHSADSEVRKRKLTNIPVGVLREFLIEPAALARPLAPGARASRVFIVDEAELMFDDGQDTLLKTLEEPGPGVVIILVTSSPDRLLATVRSRCRPVRFGPLGRADLDRWAARAGVSAPPELFEYADGSPGELARAAATSIAAWPAEIGPMLDELDRGRFPITFAAKAAELISARAEADVAGDDSASKDAANKRAARAMFRLIASHYRRRLAGEDRAGRHDTLADRFGGSAGPAEGPQAASRAAHAVRALDELLTAEQRVESNVQIATALDAWAASVASGR